MPSRRRHDSPSRVATRAVIAKRRARIVALLESLPGASAAGDQHLSLEVGGKRLGWLVEDHHGDGRVALHCRAEPGAARALVASAPERFHVPAYVGHRGWVGLWLDLPAIDWVEVQSVLVDAYRISAPKRLLARFDDRVRDTRSQSDTRRGGRSSGRGRR